MTGFGPATPVRTGAGGAGAMFPGRSAVGFLFYSSDRSGMTMRMDRPAPSSNSDAREVARLLDAIVGGDRSALGGLYRLTSSRLYAICRRMLPDDAEAEDVLQEVYVTVWRKAGLFDAAKASGQTWLAVIARNKALDRLRRRTLPTAPVEQADAVPDDAPSALDVVEASDDRQRLHHCLEQLEERQRGLIRTAFFEGATYSELAKNEDVPLGTMKSWIRRGLMRLKGCLEQ